MTEFVVLCGLKDMLVPCGAKNLLVLQESPAFSWTTTSAAELTEPVEQMKCYENFKFSAFDLGCKIPDQVPKI